MIPVCQLEWDDGILRSFGEGLPTQKWTRPADLAAARLAILPAPDYVHIENGADMLAAVFKVIPFLRGESTSFSFGDNITPPARKAFLEFAAGPCEADDFRVLRGEPGDFVVFARRIGDVWKVGALSVASGSLTVRFEELWLATPEENRHLTYRVEVLHDAVAANEILEDVAPDVRIFLDHAAGGGFLLTFTPMPEK